MLHTRNNNNFWNSAQHIDFGLFDKLIIIIIILANIRNIKWLHLFLYFRLPTSKQVPRILQ